MAEPMQIQTNGGEKSQNNQRRGRGRNRGPKKPNANGSNNTENGSSPHPPNKRPRRARDNTCFQFAKTGACERGDTCKFSHEAPKEQAPVAMDVGAEEAPRVISPSPAGDPAVTKSTHITTHKFSELAINEQSRRALKEVFQYEFMTVVQHETLPLILKGDDCLAKAKTGTGKTLGFMIPTIEKISSRKHSRSEICSLVISPTRELAMQITAETQKLIRFLPNIKVVTCVGGTNLNKDIRALKESVQIVVATPGRLLDHLQNQGMAQRMERLDSLILDEADQLLDMGFRPDIERILNLLKPSRTTRQTLLFSATVPKSVTEIANVALRPKYNFVDTVGEDSEQTHLHVKQELYVSPQEKQIHAIASLLARETSRKPYKIMVFFTTARLTGFMAELFNSVSNKTGFEVLEIHSRKSQAQRKKASDRFRTAKHAVLFSSDVSARGMDYPDVTFVLQIGLTDRAQYIHRLGRTARAGKGGKGALLLATYEERHMVHSELKDMPLERTNLDNNQDSVVATALDNVEKQKDLKLSAEQAYRAWLGYYNGALRKCSWDKRQLVVQANNWAKDIGLRDQPAIQRKTIGKMGLKNVPGIKIE